MTDMHITQDVGSRNYSLHWRDGHGTWPPGGEPAHPTVHGWMIGNHTTMPAPDTPHFNWGIDFQGTVSASPYSNWATKGVGPDCTWITFCTSCCPSAGPGCCCVSNSSMNGDHSRRPGLQATSPPDTPQPRVVHWCKHPYCPYQPPPPPPPGPPAPAPPGVPNCSAVAKPGAKCGCGPNPRTGGPGGGYAGARYCWDCHSCGTCSGCTTCEKCWDTGLVAPPTTL